jgi:hypothetical protein
MVDINLIKAGSPSLFLHQMLELKGLLLQEVEESLFVQVIPTIGVSEEVNPSKGQGFELVPLVPNLEQFKVQPKKLNAGGGNSNRNKGLTNENIHLNGFEGNEGKAKMR